MAALRCVSCSRLTESDALDVSCESCGSALVLVPRSVGATREQLESLPAGVWRYRVFLPEIPVEDVVSMGEGGTPLLRAERLGKELGFKNLMIKDESRNPSGSFIDRGSTVLVSLAKRAGVEECSCVTTGNLGASLAAYCARAGITARIEIHPSTDRGKLYQMLAFGAEVESSPARAGARAPEGRSLSVTAGNPYLLEGEKTTGFEIVQELGWKPPDAIVVPVGTGGHLSMIWQALTELRSCGLVDENRCRMLGVQLEGSRPVFGKPRGRGDSGLRRTPLTELEDSEPFFMEEVVRSMAESRGLGLAVTANDAIRATSLLARTEGIFAEPASASVVAYLEAALARGAVSRDDAVVCVITGAGLKDPKAVSKLAKAARRVPVRGDYTVARIQVGETKLSLLRLLEGRPRYGYELWQRLSAERRITTASVYQHLEELEELSLARRGASVAARGRERVPYSLTRKGVEFLKVAGRLGRKEGRAR